MAQSKGREVEICLHANESLDGDHVVPHDQKRFKAGGRGRSGNARVVASKPWDPIQYSTRSDSDLSESSQASLDGYGEEEETVEFMPGYIDALLGKEEAFCVDPEYFAHVQTHTDPQARKIVVNWMIENGEKMRVNPSTVAMAVNYFDRFMAANPVAPQFIKVVASVSLNLAIKYNESIHVPLAHFEYVAGARVEILAKVEVMMLESLNFRLSAVTPHEVVRYIEVSYPSAVRGSRRMSEMLLDFALLDTQFLCFKPSVLAAATICCGSEIMGGMTVFQRRQIHSIIAGAVGINVHDLQFQNCIAALSQSYRDWVAS